MRYAELIIFDIDGTLVDSRNNIVNAVNFTLKQLSLEIKSSQEISSYIGNGGEYLIRKSLGESKDFLFGKALSVFEEYYRIHPTEKSVLYPGAKDILENFKDKKKVVVTNGKHEFATLVLKSLGIYDYFENVMGGDNIGCMKPSPCPLDDIRHRFNIDKEKSIIVGDMDIDVIAGKRAGIITCGVTYGIGKKEDIARAKPDYIINDITELKDIIN